MPTSALLDSALTQRPFPQAQFLTDNRFRQFLRDRGLRVNPQGIRQLVGAGVVDQLHDDPAYFHPFQIWSISQFLMKLELRLTSQFCYSGLDFDALKRNADLNLSARLNEINSFRCGGMLTEFNTRILPFLLWIEQYYLPVVRGSRAGLVRLVNCDSKGWHDWKSTNPPKELLERLGVTVDQVAKWREKVLLDAYGADPAPDLYLLLRSMPFERRNRLKGSMRLAYDLYEIAEIMRLFVEEVSDLSVAKEWDPHGHPDASWVKRFYGVDPTFGTPAFLRPLIRQYGLDAAFRVMWLVEGDTEDAFILRYIHCISASRSLEFVTIRNFGGDAAFRKRIPAIDEDLKVAQTEQCFVTVTFDESGDSRRRVEELVCNGSINFQFSLSDPDFEIENFSVAELVDVASSWAEELKKPIRMGLSDVIDQVSDRIEHRQETFSKALNSVLHLNGESFRLQKGSEWGRRLADYRNCTRIQEIESGVYLESKLSKIERQILAVFRGSQPHIDYPISIEEVDPSNLEIT